MSNILRTVYNAKKRTLTQQRLNMLKFIDGYMKQYGWAPSNTDIRRACYVARTYVYEQLMTLMELGYIEYKGSRQIRVLRMPEA